MSETPPFTAQDVRDEATHFGTRAFYVHRIQAMLDAFAQRLEQEEQQQTAFAATEGAAYTIVPYEAAEALRDEGRQQERSKPLEVLQADNGDILVCYQPSGAYPASPVPFHDMRQQERI